MKFNCYLNHMELSYEQIEKLVIAAKVTSGKVQPDRNERIYTYKDINQLLITYRHHAKK